MATFGELIHGRKPDVAPFIPTDPLEELKKLLSGELGAFPDITRLGDAYQSTMMGYLQNALGPDFLSSLKTGASGAQDELTRARQFLTGDLPPDVMANVFRHSAFQNLGSGLGGSPAGAANQARQLGLSQIDLIKTGAGLLDEGTNAAQRWAQIASGTILDPKSQLYSPDWFSNFMAQQNAMKQATKQLRYNVAAAPDPAWADRAKLFANLTGSLLGAGGAGNSMNAYGTNFGGMSGAGGVAGAMGGPSGMMAGMYGSGALGGSTANFGQAGNPGFLSNFWNSYNSTDPNNTGQGVGGMFGNFLGGIFNAG